jgi:hypothetical protein
MRWFVNVVPLARSTTLYISNELMTWVRPESVSVCTAPVAAEVWVVPTCAEPLKKDVVGALLCRYMLIVLPAPEV